MEFIGVQPGSSRKIAFMQCSWRHVQTASTSWVILDEEKSAKGYNCVVEVSADLIEVVSESNDGITMQLWGGLLLKLSQVLLSHVWTGTNQCGVWVARVQSGFHPHIVWGGGC